MPSLRMAQASALYGTSGTIGTFPSTCAARPDRTEEADGFHPLRLRDRRRRLRRLRPGQPSVGRPGQLRARAGSGSRRLLLGRLHPHAGRPALPDRQPLLRLEVRVGARAADARPPDLPRPRQGARRLEQHQRDDLPARQPAGLRALGGRPGHADLGLRALPALLQPDGELPRGRSRDPFRGHDGPLALERGPATNPLFEAFFRAGEQAGYPRTDDVNGYRQEGFAPSTATSATAGGCRRRGPTSTR